MMFTQITIVGAGLIGGSLALALKKAGVCKHIIATSRNEAHLQEAVDLGVVDAYELDIAKAVKGSELVFISTPIGSMATIFDAIKGVVGEDTIITDAGSAKLCVIDDAKKVFGALPPNFVPGHPIAGAEHSGVSAAFAGLYQEHRVILTPLENYTKPEAITKVRQMWEHAGAIVSEMSASHHDDILAMTSHLPHMLAFGLVDGLAQLNDAEEIFTYAAGGFRDFTRIASGDPVMWRDICLHNRDAILKAMSVYQKDLDELKTAISNQDSQKIQSIFTSAKQARDHHILKK